MQNITRRGFVGTAAAMGVAAAAASSIAVADEAKPADLGTYAEGAPADLDWQGTPAELFALGTSTMPLSELNRRRQAYLDAQTDLTCEDGTVPADLDWQGTPAELFALGTSTMPLSELNRRRQAYLDAQTDLTCEDGTVIPAWAVKVRGLIHTYGMGCGDNAVASTFDDILATFDEDSAQAYLETPMGIAFTILDYSEKTGRTMEECEELCEYFAEQGYLCREETNQGTRYHQVPFFQGVVEYHLNQVLADPLNYNLGVNCTNMIVGPESDMATTGTPTFYAIPCDKSVVADEAGVQPYDDIEKLVAEQTTFALAPCYCRYTAVAKAMAAEGKVAGVDYPSMEDFASGEFGDYFSPVCNQRVETCLMIGEEADYWMHLGTARPITKEEALEFMQRSRDDGFILEKNFSKHMGTICSCHMDSCGIIAEWMAVGDPATIGATQPFSQISHYNLEVDTDACLKCGTCADRCPGIIAEWMAVGDPATIGATQPFSQISHYNLEVDTDACLKCGTCADRCPLHAITMDGEDGLPVVNEMCFRCGQCAWVCPVEARKLVARPVEENAPLPLDFLDDDNVKAAYRFEAGLIR